MQLFFILVAFLGTLGCFSLTNTVNKRKNDIIWLLTKEKCFYEEKVLFYEENVLIYERNVLFLGTLGCFSGYVRLLFKLATPISKRVCTTL